MQTMMTNKTTRRMNRAVGAVLCALAPLATSAASDATMMKLAATSGCLTCHQIETGAKGPNGSPPIGPAWRDVAAKYKPQKGAAEQLTRTVMSGSSLYASHWKGQVSGVAMPPNAVAISAPDARALVSWILALEARR